MGADQSFDQVLPGTGQEGHEQVPGVLRQLWHILP